MIARVFRYSFAQARTRALKGKLLSAEDWHYLLQMRNLEDLLKYLSGTDYAPVLARFAGVTPPIGGLSLALYEDLFSHAARLLKAVPKNSSLVLASLLLRYEAENLKIILRGLWRGSPTLEILALLYPLGSLSQLPVEELLQAGQVTSALDALKSSVFHDPMMHALEQFQAQGRLFPLEIAIDHTAFEHLRSDLKALTGLDRSKAQDLIGALVDGMNLTWLVRFRHLYGISPEETINYLLVGGRRLTIQDLGRLARAPDLPAFREALPAPYHEVLSRVDHWGQVQVFVERWLVGKLHDVFLKDPFQIGLPISYLLLKELEVKSLECLFSSMALGESSAKLLEQISLPITGGVRV
jgi:V/A-type H+/Na+-transporting ATPase subunit C